jgi:hypothetical protein
MNMRKEGGSERMKRTNKVRGVGELILGRPEMIGNDDAFKKSN